MFPNVSMTYPILDLVYSIMRLYSHSYGICIKILMAVSGKEFCHVMVIVHVMLYV